MIVTTPHVDPWSHPSFVPLPDVIVHGLRTVKAIEMPTRHAYEDTLQKFLLGLSAELRDTAAFPADTYAELARAVADGRLAALPARLQLWAACHHARAGSAKRHLLLLPRDAFYHMNREDEEKLRLNYVVQADGEEHSEPAKQLAENGISPAQSTAVFQRVPVQNQIYDVLVYTHRNHGGSATMLFEAHRIGMVSGRVLPCAAPLTAGLARLAGDDHMADDRAVHKAVPVLQDPCAGRRTHARGRRAHFSCVCDPVHSAFGLIPFGTPLIRQHQAVVISFPSPASAMCKSFGCMLSPFFVDPRLLLASAIICCRRVPSLRSPKTYQPPA